MDKKTIPYGHQAVDEEDIRRVVEVLRSDWLTTGPAVETFEKALAARAGARYCVVFNSGTAALHAAYFAAGVAPGREVITSPVTFPATANAAFYLGGEVVFADIAPYTFHLDPGRVEAKITGKTRVIAPVDMAGIPAALDEINEIAAGHDLVVVEDGCHALGALYDGRPVGSVADMTVFSFHPVKHITTGEGGAVTTPSGYFYRRLLDFRNHGIVRDPARFSDRAERVENDGPWYYEQQALGFNYRLPDLNCALGLGQLEKLDRFLTRRAEIASIYDRAFGENPALLIPPAGGGGAKSSRRALHLYVLRLQGDNPPRREVVAALRRRGVGTQVHYIPVYLHPFYRDRGYRPGLCPVAEDYYRRAFSIPLYPAMSDGEVLKVAGAVEEAVREVYG